MAVHPTDKEFIYGYEAGLRNAGVPVAISAGDIAYSDLQTYSDDTVGSSLQETREEVNDLKSQINNSITPYITDTMTAPAALSVGDYVMANNTLYRVIAPIANGATITPNTNVVATTEADELKRKANTDGNYPDMTVGNAEQLVATVGVEDKVPYLFRTSGGSADIGNREVDELVGGTLAWNQQIKIPATNQSGTSDGVTVTDNRDGSYTVATDESGPSSTYTGFYLLTNTDIGARKDHVVFMHSGVASDQSGLGVVDAYAWEATKSYNAQGVVYKVTDTSGRITVRIRVASGTVISTPVTVKPQWFDLTQMFGSAIADYINTLETATPGAGVAWFRKLFLKPYYAYNAGELMSVKTSAHKMVGFNAWDEEWERGRLGYDKNAASWGANVASDTAIRSKNYIPMLPGTSYYGKFASGSTAYAVFYDADKNPVLYGSAGYGAIANQTFTTPSTAHFIRFYVQNTTTYNRDICINLSWDGERDGEYEPYEAHTYALDDIELRGIPKLDADNKLYYDGDTYESDGTVTRKYGIVDLGTYSWVKVASSQGSDRAFSTTALSSLIKKPGSQSVKPSVLSSQYNAITVNAAWAETAEGISVSTGGTLTITDLSKVDLTKEQFKTAMSGVYLVYELAIPTAESADPYQNPQIVNDFGTEEYVDTRTVPIPVGHDTQYQVNLRAKLEMAPNSPDSNGDYIVRHSNGQNTYVALTFPADELPAAPTTDGTYVLKVTVASGEATYSWVSE